MDIRTVLFCLFLVNLFLGVFIFVVRNTQKHFAGINFWIYSNFLISAGYLLLSSRNEINLSISIILSQLFFLVAGFFRVSGIRRFFGIRNTKFLIIFFITVASTYIFIISYFTFINESILYRTLLQGFILSSISIYNGAIVYKKRPSTNFIAYSLTASSFFLFSSIFIFRILWWLLEPNDRGLFDNSIINQLQFLSSMIIDIIWSVMFFVMQNQRLNKQLQDREKILSGLNLGKDRFLSILAHDVKNVFNSILNIHDLMSLRGSHISKEESENYIRMLHSSTIKGYDIFEDLLLWSSSNFQKLTPNFQRLDIKKLVENVIDKIGAFKNQKNIYVTIVFTDNPIYVIADQTMIQSVLRNLVSNAIKFTNEQGKVKVMIEKKSMEVEISVQDNGVGINEANILKLFVLSEKFIKTGTAQERGTGLGLILCKELIEIHGGKIWVNSIEGVGSKFCFTLPVALPTGI